MILIDEVNELDVFEIDAKELLEALDSIKRNKEEDIRVIKDKVDKYELKRRQEEAMYQSLSPLKKLFTSHAPGHHQAVEYMVYVKDRLNSIRKIKQSIAALDKLISIVHSEQNKEEMFLSRILIEEIKAWKETEVR